MQNNKQDELRYQYYIGLRDLTDLTDFKENLPVPNSIDYLDFMKYIYEKFQGYLKEQKVEMEEALGTEYYDLYLEEVRNIENKISTIENLVNKYKNDKKDANMYKPVNHIIFAKRTFGGTYFENDLKDIAEEKYGSLIELLQTAMGNFDKNNPKNAKPLTGPLAGLNELKDNYYETRLFYRELGNGVLYVTLAKTKKSQNDKADQELPLIRKEKTNDEFEAYKKALQDPKKREEILKMEDKVTENILELLNSKKRGSK